MSLTVDRAVLSRRRRGMLLVGLAAAGVSFCMSFQLGLQANFLSDVMRVQGYQVGLLEAAREACGITALAVLAILSGLAEPLVGFVMLLLLAAGMGAYAVVPSYTWLIVVSLVWSQGLHVWMPLPGSMTLALAEPGRAGHRLGQIGAVGSVGALAALGVALALRGLGVPLRPMYYVAAGAALLAAGACLAIPRDIKTPGPRLVFRRRYGLYYLLNFLEGWRKQISIGFAGFLLTSVHHTSVETMLWLWVANSAIAFAAAPWVGRLIDRVGERRTLAFYYVSMMGMFVAYALVSVPALLWGVYVLDNAFFMFTAALTTYVNRIAPPREHTATLSMGVAVNHVAAVAMPLTGAVLWSQLGYTWTFLIGAVFAAASVAAAMRLPRHAPHPPTPREQLAESPSEY